MRMLRAFVIVVVGLSLAAMHVMATDNMTFQHWHDYTDTTWNYDQGNWSDEAWTVAVEGAADDWSTASVIDLDKVPGTSDVDISKGSGNGPCSSGQLACAQQWWNLNYHFIDVNIYFNEDYDWGEEACSWDIDEYSKYSVALHELGHAFGLDHSSDSAAIMYGGFSDADCKLLDQHDIDSMEAQYEFH